MEEYLFWVCAENVLVDDILFDSVQILGQKKMVAVMVVLTDRNSQTFHSKKSAEIWWKMVR